MPIDESKPMPMLATRRWAEAFMSNLECVKCRTKENLILYGYDKKPIDYRDITVEDLKRRLARIDVWCDQCEPRINFRVQGNPRQSHKEVAAQLADLQVNIGPEPKSDLFLMENGQHVTRQDIIRHAKNRSCQVCGIQYPYPAMQFHHVDPLTKVSGVSAMNYSTWSIKEILTEIEKCAIVCANCHYLITAGMVKTPRETVSVDDDFWRGLVEAKSNGEYEF